MVLYTADNLPSKRTSAPQKVTVDSAKNNCGLVYAESTYTYESYRPSLLKFNDFAMEATLRLISFMWEQLLFFVVWLDCEQSRVCSRITETNAYIKLSMAEAADRK